MFCYLLQIQILERKLLIGLTWTTCSFLWLTWSPKEKQLVDTEQAEVADVLFSKAFFFLQTYKVPHK